jgi:hypothetical protein
VILSTYRIRYLLPSLPRPRLPSDRHISIYHNNASDTCSDVLNNLIKIKTLSDDPLEHTSYTTENYDL